jgi:hypothetical protein
LKHNKKFVAQYSGLSIAEKTSATGIKVVGKKASSTSAGGSGMPRSSARALDLFDSGSSTSDGKATLLELPQKCPRKPPLPKNVLKPSTAKGNFE